MLRRVIVCAAKVKPLQAPKGKAVKKISKIDQRILALAAREKEVTDDLKKAQREEDENPTGLDRRVVTERIIGTIEDFSCEGPLHNGHQQFWKHNYVVDGTLVVKFLNKSWMVDRPQVGMDIGVAVSLSCTRNNNGVLRISNMRRANPTEKKELVRKAHQREVARSSNLHEVEIRKRIPFAILESKLSGNLDKEGFQQAILAVYRFVKPEVFKEQPKTEAKAA